MKIPTSDSSYIVMVSTNR
jgi:hypothetical protein